MENYRRLIKLHLNVLPLVGSTCKPVLPVLKHLKSKHRSALTNTHVKRIALSGNKRIPTRFEANYCGQELPDICVQVNLKNYK